MLGSHIYYTNSFSAWQISGNDIKKLSKEKMDLMDASDKYLVTAKYLSVVSIGSNFFYHNLSDKYFSYS